MPDGRVADAVARELAAAGIRRLYGMPGGGSNMALIEAAAERGVDFVLLHQEPAAIFAAAGEAEATGRPAACVATLGPGVANSVNGLAHCLLDRVPVVLISDSPGEGPHLHQRLDHTAVVGGTVKDSRELAPADAASTVRASVETALRPPRGPVHLGLSGAVAASAAVEESGRAGAPALDATPPAAVADAAELIRASRRPVVLAGLEAADPAGAAAVRSLAARLGAPVLTTYKAKGVVDEGGPDAAGLVTNGAVEGRVLDLADALVLVGLDEVELMPGAWRWPRPTLAIGRSAATAQHLAADVVLPGDPAALAARLEAALGDWRAAWSASELPSARPARDEVTLRGSGGGVAPADVVLAARGAAPPGTVAAVDAGSHMFAATLFWDADEPRCFLISNGLSTMGYALPAALGAWLARPDRAVVCFTGDGGLAMVSGELETLARLGARVVVVVFHDSTLNLIRIKQEKRGGTTRGLDFGAVDWSAVARGMGVQAERVAEREALGAAFDRALAADGPYLLDVIVDTASYGRMLNVIRG